MLTKPIIVFVVCMVFSAGFSSADQCIICRSSKDKNCAQNPELMEAENCKEKSNCYVRIHDGETIRGCLADLNHDIQQNCTNDTSGASCFVCENAINSKSSCNNIIFPINRLRCHTCEENELKGPCFTGLTGNAKPCINVNPENKCFTRKTAKSIERGCLSDTTKCTKNDCLTCPGDGCNNLMGNDTSIPTAKGSATAWTSTMTVLLVPAIISLQFTL